MSKKKRYIRYPKERAILSDVLPYEVPITFSNRYFYRFLVNFNIFLDNEKVNFENNLNGQEKIVFEEILKILFHHDYNNEQDYKFRKIPFAYRITHKENDFRELAVIHPINQLKLIKFYDDFKESILYSCSISNFSVRKPVDIAKFTFFNDKLHQLNKGDENDFLELSGKEYENLKTFFSYKKYTNIYKFYEDYRYHRAEKKYNFLFKFDIAKCFDTIYTHSISWAVLGLDAVKENVEESKKNFSGIFDKFIQNANYGETNGILIGPEFSRIFAEIILQRIDKTVEDKVGKLEKGYKNKIDYEIYRYVDDYFLFCDDEILKNEILRILKHELKEYKLSINNSKSKEYSKPIITEITIAKEKINKLFSENPRFSIKELDKNENQKEGNNEDIEILNHKFSFYFNPDNLITQYKILIKESSVDYKDVLNYSLALLNSIIERNLVNFENVYLPYLGKIKSNEISDKSVINKLNKVEDSLTTHLVSFIDFVFFIYSVSPRVNSTIKTCHILSKILTFYKLKDKSDKKFLINSNNRNRIFKKILDESSLIIKKNSITEYAQIETLYLLTVIRELDKEFRIPEISLEKFIGIKANKIPDGKLNYFSIVVLVFYLGHSKKYPKLRVALLDYIENYIKNFPIEKRSKSSELTHLILDLLACPFIEDIYKIKIFALYKNYTTKGELLAARRIIYFHKKHIKYWFTKWERFNLAKELEHKRSQEVYS
ncbi:antiviral reverse transcriptase Drt3b [Flavobacterium humi]|uniref:RNA-directed DNA polymerase n=1 Tax=Flavobacterium humi TaxID=2562683 RepID=A0A4Z0L6X3_9FLAO|nr:antiviral reverse transcriptase Drt3b [Flavobacterium humi]TGD57519.1 RNA-directed DNA polymerase [Flavobacterium humi]